jgi:hypothetical protein
MPLPSGTKSSLGMPLFLRGYATRSSGVPLFVDGGAHPSGALPLFAWGKAAGSRGMPLVVATAQPAAAAGGVTLALNGSAHPAWFRGLDLVCYTDASGNVAARHMPLFLAAAAKGTGSRNVNLSVRGAPHAAGRGLDLTVWNNRSGVSLGTTLYVSGDGSTPGALPAHHGLNLVLARNPANAIPLHLHAPGTPAASGLTLFLRGDSPASAGLPFAVPKVVGGPTKAVRLFTSGW